MDAESKADLLLRTFTSKFSLIPEELNEYSHIEPSAHRTADFLPIRARHTKDAMKNLNEDSGTGPDKVSAKILKHCCSSLATPVAMLARIIVKQGAWPSAWEAHWIVPLFQKKAVFDPKNYRGVHLTPQLSKVVERLLGRFLLPFFEATEAYGPNQFA